MLPAIPRLEDHSISVKNGFLPDQLPVRRLKNSYYEPWEAIIDDLQAMILSKKIRLAVNRLPVLSTQYLETELDKMRAYSVLGFLAHSYIWGGDEPCERLPACIAVPFLEVSKMLEIAPVASYAAVALWNYRTLFSPDDLTDLSNLATIQTFTGSLDESWFYLVSIAIEAKGAAVLPRMLKAIEAARRDDAHTVMDFLNMFAETLEEITEILGRMFEQCDPHVFYFKIRPFLAGSQNMAEAGVPRGVFYEDVYGGGEWMQYAGGSNAQSSIIQAFDIALAVEHRPTGMKKRDVPAHHGTAPPQKHNFIEEMRTYMPGPHRRFLERLASVANIRPYCEAHQENKALVDAYDSCLAMLRAFRDKHIQIVSRYIVIQSRKNKKEEKSGVAAAEPAKISRKLFNVSDKVASTTHHHKNLATVDATKKGLTGTGGTALIPFLKQARDETGEPAIGPSAQRIFRGAQSPGTRTPALFGMVTTPSIASATAPPPPGFEGLGQDTPAEPLPQPMVGLAGYWLNNQDFGGLCSY